MTLLQAAKDFLAKVHECSQASYGVYILAANHGYVYCGPTWEAERKALEAAIEEEERKCNESRNG